MILIAVTAVNAMTAGALSSPGPADEARLQGEDVIARPGEAVELRAKLEAGGLLNRDLESREVAFYRGGHRIGTDHTDDDGFASLTFPWPTGPDVDEGPDELSFSVRWTRHPAVRGGLIVRYVPEDRPVLVVDLDGTICVSGALDVARLDPAEVEAAPGAAGVLRELAAHYEVLYLSARDNALGARSRSWLSHHGFPSGVLLTRDLSLRNLSAESFKTRRLLELGERFDLVAGVGDRDEDARAYLEAGLYAIMIGDEDDVPEEATKVVRWSEVGRLLRPPLDDATGDDTDGDDSAKRNVVLERRASTAPHPTFQGDSTCRS